MRATHLARPLSGQRPPLCESAPHVATLGAPPSIHFTQPPSCVNAQIPSIFLNASVNINSEAMNAW